MAKRYNDGGDDLRTWLRSIREKGGLTQEDIAKDALISRAYYTEIESGHKNPSVSVAKRISTKLNLDWTLKRKRAL